MLSKKFIEDAARGLGYVLSGINIGLFHVDFILIHRDEITFRSKSRFFFRLNEGELTYFDADHQNMKISSNCEFIGLLGRRVSEISTMDQSVTVYFAEGGFIRFIMDQSNVESLELIGFNVEGERSLQFYHTA